MNLAALTLIFSFCFAPLVAAATAPSAANDRPLPVLPKAFAGWEISGEVHRGSDPHAVDEAQSAALKEYGFIGYELANYSQPGSKLTVRLARFQDATGAYGAFTFYRMPGMLTESIGTMAAGDNNRVLFFQQNYLVEARFDHVSGMTAAELRELAAALPTITGPAAHLPSLPSYLPREKMTPNTAKYVLGRAAYAAVGLPIPESVIDFSRGPEILAARIAQPDAPAEIVLINYPTPQIAIERLPEFEKVNPVQDATYAVRRTGPIIKIVYGSISQPEADAILRRVNYQAEVTWNENTGLSKRDNVGNLVIAALTLAGIVSVISLGTGVIFAFGRKMLPKIFPQHFRKSGEDADIIQLNLRR